MTRSWRLARSLVQLRDEVNGRWPKRATTSDGALGDAAHSARRSDHNPDDKGVVRAVDVTEWDPDTPHDDNDDVAEVIAETLRASRDPRIKYVIWRGRMFSSYGTSSRRAWEWGPYSGPNGHFQHVHVSVVADDRADGTAPWGISATPKPPAPPPPAPVEDDMLQLIQTADNRIFVTDGLRAKHLAPDQFAELQAKKLAKPPVRVTDALLALFEIRQ